MFPLTACIGSSEEGKLHSHLGSSLDPGRLSMVGSQNSSKNLTKKEEVSQGVLLSLLAG